MQVHDWKLVAIERMNPLFARQVIHSDTMTVARVHLQKGCVVPEHSHHNDQISMVEQGELRFVIAGVPQVLSAGQLVHIAPHVPHSVDALEDSVAVDVFSPPREDWIRGDDAYLRR
jgi:quercetin dioxygenase-like cupin family protein